MKPTFAKMSLKVNSDIKTIIVGDQEIEIKQYLPINEKLEIIGDAINQSMDDNNFVNCVKLSVFVYLGIIFKYTNIGFTDKQKEDYVKLYDLLDGNGIIEQVINNIPQREYDTVFDGASECAEKIYEYRNSIYGIMESISKDYKNMDVDIETIRDKLGDLGDIELLRNVMTKLG